MEQCFQRTLWEYENFIARTGTPTLVCRRTGEVAAVGTEFTYLTGWRKGILLGKEPNLNTNIGRGGKEEGSTGASSRGTMNTPGLEGKTNMGLGDAKREQPVFIGELLDDESVIEFYEDFSRLAFEDPRGSVTRRCGLLKYLTKEELSDGGNTMEADKGIGVAEEDEDVAETGSSTAKSKRKGRGMGDVGEAEIDDLAKDGKVDCTYCWTVKRDVFDIPMLLVMNVSSPFGRPRSSKRKERPDDANVAVAVSAACVKRCHNADTLTSDAHMENGAFGTTICTLVGSSERRACVMRVECAFLWAVRWIRLIGAWAAR